MLSLGDFTDSASMAAKLSLEQGISFNEALRQVNEQKENANAKESLARAQQKAMMDAAIEKMAKLGTEDRKDLPQVSVDTVRNSDIPTGYLEFVDPKKLKPIQRGVDEDKVNDILTNWDVAGKVPVLISKDNWVIDGHHRVKAAIKKNKWVRVIRISLPGKKALTAVKKLESK